MPYILLYNGKKAKNQKDDVAQAYISDDMHSCREKIKEISKHFNIELKCIPNKTGNAWVAYPPGNKVFARIGYLNIGKVRMK